MTFAIRQRFTNFAEGNEAGVCEAAVCLWLKRIKDRVGAFNWGSSAADWLPGTEEANDLYNEFTDGDVYVATYQSYLQIRAVYDPAKGRPGDANALEPVVPCSHYSGNAIGSWSDVLDDMRKGDALFVALSGGVQVGHAIGVYRGTDYIFLFDPNEGLYRGNGWPGCCGCKKDDLWQVADHLDGFPWTRADYFGVHLRAA
ncbi:MAG: hypothetical protein QOC81_2203 [Thermoanaerobaculia bacterium]|jgi:hypothetical protein|nr:hypothetical protein [Thermoanaerobaculia bacterium]